MPALRNAQIVKIISSSQRPMPRSMVVRGPWSRRELGL
jgi:hypothetical protein